MQFRAPKDFGPLFGPQLKLNSRKVSQKSFKTVCFRFVNLFIRNWNYSRHKFSNFASAGLFTIWNVRLVHVFQGRQPYCLNFVLVHVQRGVFRWPRPRIHGPDSFISTPVFVSYVCSLRLLIADICTTCLLATSQRIWVKVGSSQNSEVEINLIPRRPADLHLEPDLPVTLDSHNSVSNYRVNEWNMQIEDFS